MSVESLKTEIADTVSKLDALERQREALLREIDSTTIRLTALKDALTIVTGFPRYIETTKPPIQNPDPWEDALRVIAAKGGQFTTDEVVDECAARGGDMPRSRARSRLAHLVDRKILKRLDEGIFRFSPASPP
jgi:hypothetical protein